MHLIDRGVNLSNLVLHLLFLYYSNTSARLLPCLDPRCDHTHTHLFLAQWKEQSWAWVSHRQGSTTTLKIHGVGASQWCRNADGSGTYYCSWSSILTPSCTLSHWVTGTLKGIKHGSVHQQKNSPTNTVTKLVGYMRKYSLLHITINESMAVQARY